MLEPVLVVAGGVVGARVRAARLRARERADRGGQGHVEHALELDGADHVEVEDAARVAQADARAGAP